MPRLQIEITRSGPGRPADGPASAVGARPADRRAAWLGLLAFALYLPPAISVLQLQEDAVEYVDIARRLSAGEGYRLGVKAFHAGGSEVVHDGLAERAPLVPLLIAGLLKLGLELSAVQMMNAVLAAGCVALVCAIGTYLFGRTTGTLAGLLAAASPAGLVHLLPPMTEAAAIFCLLLATWLLVANLDRPRPAPFALAGAALGLGYLARPTMAALAAALLLGIIAAAPRRRALLRPLVALCLIGAVFTLPITLYSLATRGRLAYSGQTFLYSVAHDIEVVRDRPVRPLPSPAEFVRSNLPEVGARIRTNLHDYAEVLFLDRWSGQVRWLFLLLPAWPAATLALVRGRYPPAAGAILLLAGANFLLHAFTWATWEMRYQLLTLLLLLPFAVDGLARLGLARIRFRLGQRVSLSGLQLAVAAVALAWSPMLLGEYRGTFWDQTRPVGTRSDQGLTWTGPTAWVEDAELGPMLEWIAANTDGRDVLAAAQPWPFTFFTNRPATLLPANLDQSGLRSFLADYRVAYVLLDDRENGSANRRRFESMLRRLSPESARVIPLGSYRVFDTRALWQARP